MPELHSWITATFPSGLSSVSWAMKIEPTTEIYLHCINQSEFAAMAVYDLGFG